MKEYSIQFMSSLSADRIAESFFGILFALSFAGLVWLIKSFHDNYRRELFSIVRLERNFVENLVILQNHISLIDQWIVALKSDQKYSTKFGVLIIDNESHMGLSDMKLVNLIVEKNFKYKGLNDDLSHIYGNYKEFWLHYIEKKISQEKLKQSSLDILSVLKVLKVEIIKMQASSLEIISYLRLAGRTKKHSLFGYLNFLHMDIWPKINEKKVSMEIIQIKKELDEKRRAQEELKK